jgi:radical SAM protein with 4Fe4S-binding SPASM domain
MPRVDTAVLSALGKSADNDRDLRTTWLEKAYNLKRAWEHFEAADLVISTMPFRVSLELTQNCNFKCIMCSQSWEEKFQRYNPDFNMPMELFVRLAEQFFPSAVNVDLRGFGETTILPHWPEVVDVLDGYPYIEWNLVSNLSLARDDVWEKMMKNNFVIGFSCDGATAPTFETIRAGGNFARTLHNIEVIQSACKKHESGYLYMISVIQRMNAHEMRAIVELAHRFGINEVQFHIVRGPKFLLIHTDPFMHDDKFPSYVDAAIDAGLDLGVYVTFNDVVFTRKADPDKLKRVSSVPRRELPVNAFHGAPWKAEMAEYETRLVGAYRVVENQRCFKPFSYGNVNYDGIMGTCNHMQYPSMPNMGDLRTQSVVEVWNGEKYQDFRRQLLNARPKDARCQWCFAHRLAD